MRNIKSLILAVIVSIALFFVVRPVLAQVSISESDIELYLQSNDLLVGSEVIDGYQEVFFVFQDQKIYVTEGSLNCFQPNTSGRFIVYVKEINGRGQIFLYDVISQTTIQITSTGTNLEPKVSDQGWVVWEGWAEGEEGGWQVYLYDGKQVRKLTQGDLSMNPFIEGEVIVYARRDITGTWRSVAYSVPEDKVVDITTGEGSREPQIVDGKILLAGGKEEFPLTLSDLFLLDFVPLDTSYTSEDIINEIDNEPLVSTQSGQLDTQEEFEEDLSNQATSPAQISE